VSNDDDVRALIEAWATAVRSHDIDGVLRHHGEPRVNGCMRCSVLLTAAWDPTSDSLANRQYFSHEVRPTGGRPRAHRGCDRRRRRESLLPPHAVTFRKNVVADGRGEGFSRVVGREVEALSHGHAELSRHDSQSSPDAQGFLMKDFFLLGAAIWSAGEALQASTHNSKP